MLHAAVVGALGPWMRKSRTAGRIEMGEVVQLRDFQNPKDIERMRQALEREAAEIMAQVDGNINVPYNGAGIDGMDLGKEPA
jgi:hypothetical protein